MLVQLALDRWARKFGGLLIWGSEVSKEGRKAYAARTLTQLAIKDRSAAAVSLIPRHDNGQLKERLCHMI